ncbi:hypothetical protein AAFF_G00291220 [Aldrovandia affinis]|uniref:ADF-H domain-containing protein n=1 Tax=Aldrovandia affinis TaxID=143900 RepID=A0AAD7R9Z5_9TELE|nr:hypothetical protein AAFF_G00291220 [Aldrovandia affinis]
MDTLDAKRELSEFEQGVIVGARISGASRAEAQKLVEQVVRATNMPKAPKVTVSEDVVTVFNEMKAQAGEEEKRKKAVLFCLSDDKKSIVLEEGREILQGDLGNSVQDPYLHFVKMLPPDDCRYALYDASYETRRKKREDLVFIFWDPESAPQESRMIYASSKSVIKKKFAGIKHEWHVKDSEDIKDRRNLAEKLGGRSVVSLEGSPV